MKDELKSRLFGQRLIDQVKMSSHLSKAQVALDCGYLGGIDDDGTYLPDFSGFYEALLEASGAELVHKDLKQGITVLTTYQDDAMNFALDIVLYYVAVSIRNGVKHADYF